MSQQYERPAKRQKINEHSFSQGNVSSPDQIHSWLEFQQSTDPSIKAGINFFREWLASVARDEDSTRRARDLQSLKEYCQWQRAPSDDQVNFYDLLSTWSFAVDNNAEAIISAVPSALAQFLKTISGSIDLRPSGLSLIDSLLRRDQAKLFEKCLLSPRTKPHLASPCLRLLTEILTFDAGARTTEFWYRRDLIMHKFEATLEQQNTSRDYEERRKPSVRRMALRLMIAMLKYLDSNAKTDLLIQARALHACLRGLSGDSDDIVVDFLRSVDVCIFDDGNIPRSAIARFWNVPHLESLAALYTFELDDEAELAKAGVKGTAHKLLLKLCTTTSGVVITQQGWYPPSTNVQPYAGADHDYIDLGLDSPFYFDDYKDKVPVANVSLAMFLQKLKLQDSLQSTILQATLQAVPELVADYFSKRRQIPTANSEDLTWRSQFALLFSVVETPVPNDLGHSDGLPQSPPPLTIAVESILPRPLDRKYLTSMLSSSDDVLRISAARIVSVALKKLNEVLDVFLRYSANNAYLWQQAADRLSELVETRVPAVRDLTLALQHTSGDDIQVRPALLECLLAYYKVLSSSSALSSFDVGPLMLQLCSALEDAGDKSETFMEQLSWCVQIADLSSSTKWLHKSGGDTLSPLVRVLKVITRVKSSIASRLVAGIIHIVLVDSGVIGNCPATFAALCNSLAVSVKFSPSTEIFEYIDTCASRTSQKPVKYLDDIEHASQIVSDKKPLSLFVAAVSEQWEFALKKHEHSKSTIKNIATWIARLFTLLDGAGENYRVMMHFQESMLRVSLGKHKEYLQDALSKARKKTVVVDTAWPIEVDSTTTVEIDIGGSKIDQLSISKDLEKLSANRIELPDTIQGLDKWPADFDIELEINTHRLQRLVLCLSAPDAEIRLQASPLLQQITHTIDTTSTFEGKQQIYLILGELCETVTQYNSYSRGQTLPMVIPELANALLTMSIQPQHMLFSKANKFLLHKPSWTPKGALLYWIEHILRQTPDSDEDDAWNMEREWLLRLLLSGLRGDVDADLYRRCNILEHVSSLYASPCISNGNKKLILALLLRAMEIPGGADMLWTRFGVHSWLSAMEVNDGEHEAYLRFLRARLEEKCDKQMIEEWKLACSLNRNRT